MLVRICHFTEETWLREHVLKACHGTNFLSVSVLFIFFFFHAQFSDQILTECKVFWHIYSNKPVKVICLVLQKLGDGVRSRVRVRIWKWGRDTLKMCMRVYTKQFVRRDTHTWCLYKRNTRCLEVTHMLCVLFNKNVLFIISVYWKVSF